MKSYRPNTRYPASLISRSSTSRFSACAVASPFRSITPTRAPGRSAARRSRITGTGRAISWYTFNNSTASTLPPGSFTSSGVPNTVRTFPRFSFFARASMYPIAWGLISSANTVPPGPTLRAARTVNHPDPAPTSATLFPGPIPSKSITRSICSFRSLSGYSKIDRSPEYGVLVGRGCCCTACGNGNPGFRPSPRDTQTANPSTRLPNPPPPPPPKNHRTHPPQKAS